LIEPQKREAIGRLIIQYRVERMARWLGRLWLFIGVLFLIAALVSIFTPTYLWAIGDAGLWGWGWRRT